MKYIFFRVLNDSDYIQGELKKGILRQGWGNSTSQIRDENGNDKPYEDWRLEDSNRKKTKFNNIRKLLEINKGDIIVIPKVPHHDTFTICQANGDYYFDLNHDIDDFGHCIPIDVTTLKEFSYHTNRHAEIVHSKLRAYQRSINFVGEYQEDLINAMNELLSHDTNFKNETASDLIKITLKENLIHEFSNYSPHRIEDVVKDIFQNAGYMFMRKNKFDKKGGDADLIFSKPIEILGNNDESYTIYVQVKNKKGNIDYNELEGLNQLDQIVESDEIDKDYKKILISTIHDFQDNTKIEAQNRDITLINGNQFAELIMKYLY